jgi:large subunit ribosomal protein L24
MKIHTGDTVVVTTGKDRGKTGKVIRVLRDKQLVVVEGINMRTKHIRKTAQQPGQRLRYEASLHVCKVMVVDPKTKKPTRIHMQIDPKTGAKSRVAARSGSVLERGAAAAKVGKSERARGAPVKEKEKGEVKKSEKGAVPGGLPNKQPFWKRMGFGAKAAQTDGDVPMQNVDEAASVRPQAPSRRSRESS